MLVQVTPAIYRIASCEHRRGREKTDHRKCEKRKGVGITAHNSRYDGLWALTGVPSAAYKAMDLVPGGGVLGSWLA